MAQLADDMQVVLDTLEDMGWRSPSSLSPVDARLQPGLAHAALAVQRATGGGTMPPEVTQLEYRFVPGAEGEVATRILTPVLSGPAPIVLYIPDGAWVAPDLDAAELAARALTTALPAVVVTMRYHAAPEHRFPVAHDDAFAVYDYLREHARHLGGDPDHIVVAGEGAGANLAMNVAIRARDEGVPPPAHQLLVCPVAGTDLDTPSCQEHADACPLDRPTMDWGFRHLVGRFGQRDHPELALSDRPDLGGLPPVTLLTAEIDPLRSDGEQLADALDRDEVPVSHQAFDGVTHGFFGLGGVVAQAEAAMAFAVSDIRRALATVPTRDTSVQPSVAP